MAKLNEKQLTFEGVMKIVQGNKWIQLKDIERLEKFIQNQQATIQSLKEDNERLQKDVENLQEVVAELGATLLMHGFEIEINDENLSEMIDNG